MSADGGSVNASNINTAESKKVKKTRKPFVERSHVWKHFSLYNDENGNLRAKCNYCVATYARDDRKNSGTSNMKGHLTRCPNNPENNSGGQSNLVNDTEGNVGVFKFDQKKGRRALVEWAVVDGLSFNAFEKEGFKRFVRAIQPAFVIPSRVTIARDCIQMYLDEKAKLKAAMKKYVHRVCLTTDTWTSLQRINYMCLTVHYIDENWNLQKKVINFCPISSHRGNDIGKALELCLADWGLKKNIMTVTVDNASSNDVAVQYLIGKMAKWGDSCIVEGKWTHVRCVAHILNLIVQDGLKDLGKSVERIRAAVRWVRSSVSRLKEFNNHVKSSQVQCTKSLILDVPTRWKSTYLMLDVAVQYEKAFENYIDDDLTFTNDLLEGCGVPDSTDFANAKRMGAFLKTFYEITLCISGTQYVTSNTYLDNINVVDVGLKKCLLAKDKELVKMAQSMIAKFEKYWGDVKKFNLMVFIASLFDPRTKFDYLELTLCNMYGNSIGGEISRMCKSALVELFNDYKRLYSEPRTNIVSSTSKTTVNVEAESNDDGSLFVDVRDTVKSIRERQMAELKRRKLESGVAEDSKTELDRYLDEQFDGDKVWFESGDFTVLGWWRKRGPAFPILSLLARDILAIPISTVASESTFSTGGRVLDTFRCSLNPTTVEALICCQDWIRNRAVPCNVKDNIEELDKLFEEMNEMPPK